MLVHSAPRITINGDKLLEDSYDQAFRDLTNAVSGGLRSSGSILELAAKVHELQRERGFDPDAPLGFGQPARVDYVVTSLIISVTESLKAFSPQMFSLKSVTGGVEITFTLEDVSSFASKFKQVLSGEMQIQICLKTDKSACRITFGDKFALDYFSRGYTIYSRVETVEGKLRVIPAKRSLRDSLFTLLGL